jgi:hypothetical protein
MPADPPSPGEPAPETCPGCGVVLAPSGGSAAPHPGASASCRHLFEVTIRGLREEAASDPAASAAVRRADTAYRLQHSSDHCPQPSGWRTTIADVAADLDVIDLPVLVGAWADAVETDLAAAAPGSQLPHR